MAVYVSHDIEASEQPDAADERGASDGRSPLIWVFSGRLTS